MERDLITAFIVEDSDENEFDPIVVLDLPSENLTGYILDWHNPPDEDSIMFMVADTDMLITIHKDFVKNIRWLNEPCK